MRKVVGEMRNIALILMYNGSAYHGWQVQKNAVTVAETLEQALATVVGHSVNAPAPVAPTPAFTPRPILPTSAPPLPFPVTASPWR